MAEAANGERSLPKLFPPTPKDLAIQGKRMLQAVAAAQLWDTGFWDMSAREEGGNRELQRRR